MCKLRGIKVSCNLPTLFYRRALLYDLRSVVRDVIRILKARESKQGNIYFENSLWQHKSKT